MKGDDITTSQRRSMTALPHAKHQSRRLFDARTRSEERLEDQAVT